MGTALFSNRQYAVAMIVTSVLTLIYLLINLFVIGGDAFVYALNNNITIPLAVVTTVFAFSLWNLVNTGWTNRMLWGGLLVGWVMWTIAEILWVVYGYLYQDVPYPSLADFFWLAGYFPMWYGLYFRSREIPTKPSSAQRVLLWSISLVTIVITVIFVLIPIIQSNNPSNWLESILNIIYPLTDLLLLIILLRLIFVYGSGDYGFGWNMMAVGFALHSISNLIFSYASQLDIYYPELKVNLISSVAIDAPYNISYLFWLFGLYVLRFTLNRYRPFGKILPLSLVPNTSILIYLKGDHTLLDTSRNIYLISGALGNHNPTLKELLGISQKEERIILQRLITDGKIADHSLKLNAPPEISSVGYLSGVATRSPSGEYSGANLVMRVLVRDDYTVDESLSREERFMVSHLRKATGSNEREHIRKLLLDYHLAYLKRLYNLTFRTGGAQLGMVFMQNLQKIGDVNQWHLRFDPNTLIDDGDYQIALLREALPVLLEESKHFVSHLTDRTAVEAEMQFVSSQFSEADLMNVRFYS